MGRRSGIHVDPRRAEPIYRQIFDRIVDRIQSGAFPAGHRLPPTRTLASELGAHRNTVVRAYEDLETAGFVLSTVGRGTFVAPRQPSPRVVAPASNGAAHGQPSIDLPWSSILSTAAMGEPLGRFDRLGRGYARSDLINLTRMQPSLDLLPDDLFRRCIEHVMRTLGPRALVYGPREGLPRLREVIADDLTRQGVPARADDIIVTTGSQQALDLAARALCNPGDPFLVENLTYGGAISVLTAAGAKLISVPSDEEGPSMSALSRLGRIGAKGCYLMPSCHNPTGLSVSPERREELIAWSHDAGVPFIEDDYGADLNLDSEPMPPALRSLDGNVLYVGSFSKKLIPALRVGFLMCPAPIRPVLVSLKHALDLGTSVLLQHVLAEFLERGYMRAHLGRILPEYRARRDALEKGLQAHLPKSIRWRHPERGVVAWIPLPAGWSPEAICDEARRQGVLVSPSTLYSVDPRPPPGIRLTFCAEPAERLREGARRLGKAFAAAAADRRLETRAALEVV